MPETSFTLDTTSIRILNVLQENCEISNSDLAMAAGISASPCWRRVNEMKNQGVIQRSVAIVNPLALGLAVNVFVHVSLTHQDKHSLEIFNKAVKTRPEVMECYLMSGESDYMLRIVVEDLMKFQELILDLLTKIPVVSNIRSSFALSQIKYTTALPTGHLAK
ncbi:Lrp/AsnC family transcriptional regulator [Acetobacter tropicalis]|uniref:Transcriptional regulator Lrp/AsnC n=1 Tax=Acetobacter tropicalis NBRC 101654 TaxID=749388 RepID=F7VCG5_9PROT|nr:MULTISPECIES: Lrp/AsnC family transcriptional regulator [Acetobacter]MCP1194348.1 Lrp/AsnC family transcriptional regulator [Acetobacter senegalensis]GAA08060.1 transcriptional regulator Lrp/AsnC [Acetobacter tropicalis NBRC 101654]